MFTALAAAAALSLAPAQPDALKLTNVRWTIGELGPTRKESKLIPGDLLFIGYDIENITIDGDGNAKYTMGMEVSDAAGKSIFKQDPRELTDFIPLRGNKLPARAFLVIGLDQPAGVYSCKLTVTDPKTKATSSLAVKFEVAKPEFGILAVNTSYDEGGKLSAPTTGVVGQTVYIHFSVANFTRDTKTKQPNIEFLFETLDEAGKPTRDKPTRYVQDGGIEEKDGAFSLRFPVFMSRTGKFTARITATDKVGNKKSVYELPLTILGSN
jgi:hypothetical protein